MKAVIRGGARAINPFSTRCVRSGRFDFYDSRVTVDQLVQRFLKWNSRATIVGGHGTGKTTLLMHLISALGPHFRSICLVTIGSRGDCPTRERRLDWIRSNIKTNRNRADGRSLLVVDGIDSLPWIHRQGLFLAIRQRGLGLLTTAHQPSAWPVLWRTQSQLSVFLRLADRLQTGYACPLSHSVLESCFQIAAGNMREALFLAYDRYADGIRNQAVAAESVDSACERGRYPCSPNQRQASDSACR